MEREHEEPRPVRKALIISVSHYDSTNLTKLPFVENDGIKMAELLESLGYEIADNNKLIGNVSWENMRKSIIDFFKTAKHTDTLLFYYSGHGVPDIKGDLYLATSETIYDDPYEGGFSFGDLTERMRQSKSTKKIVLLDCCYSGLARLGKGSAEDAASLGLAAISHKGSQLLHSGEGICILAACQDYQQAVILIEENHSLFTYYLLKGLQGSGEAVDNRGHITADSLSNFVYNSIMSLPEEKTFKQKPIRILEASGNIILVSPTDLSTPNTRADDRPTIVPAKLKSLTKVEDKKQRSFKNSKILILVISAIIIGNLIALVVSGFFGGMLHQPSSLPSTNKTIPSINEHAKVIPAKNFLTYQNSTYGIRIQYPPSWYKSIGYVPANVSESGNNQGIISFFPHSKKDSAAVKISVNYLNTTKGVAEYLSDKIVAYRDNTEHFKSIEVNTNSTLSGLPAYRLVYTSAIDYRFAPKTDHFKDLEVGTIDGARVYYIQYKNDPIQFDSDLPIVQKMINSFQITSQPQLGNQTFTYHGGYLDGLSDARKGVDEGYPSDDPYAMGYREGHRAGLKNAQQPSK
jgi:Caspase domain/PsbP-like protein